MPTRAIFFGLKVLAALNQIRALGNWNVNFLMGLKIRINSLRFNYYAPEVQLVLVNNDFSRILKVEQYFDWKSIVHLCTYFDCNTS